MKSQTLTKEKLMDERAHELLVAQLRAIAHPVRLRMVELIDTHGGDVCVCEIERHFELKQPTISHHLKILRDAGIIRSRQDGSWVRHRVERGTFARLSVQLAAFSG